ncbi:MAG: hypothetical protein ACREMV_15085 [Gemmatimonadales bacterium]
MNIDLARRVVTLEIPAALDAKPFRAELPVHVVKQVAAALLAAEADKEAASTAPRIVALHG